MAGMRCKSNGIRRAWVSLAAIVMALGLVSCAQVRPDYVSVRWYTETWPLLLESNGRRSQPL
jgi:hypothetical protein